MSESLILLLIISVLAVLYKLFPPKAVSFSCLMGITNSRTPIDYLITINQKTILKQRCETLQVMIGC